MFEVVKTLLISNVFKRPARKWLDWRKSGVYENCGVEKSCSTYLISTFLILCSYRTGLQ